jgi:hypothetical protein
VVIIQWLGLDALAYAAGWPARDYRQLVRVRLTKFRPGFGARVDFPAPGVLRATGQAVGEPALLTLDFPSIGRLL